MLHESRNMKWAILTVAIICLGTPAGAYSDIGVLHLSENRPAFLPILGLCFVILLVISLYIMLEEADILDFWLTKSRVESLIDGVFAIVMTLIVLTIEIPHLADTSSDSMLLLSLIRLLPSFIIYVLAFFLLAIFWRNSHLYFNFINRVDNRLLWMVVLWLMAIAFVPFSSSLLGAYGNSLVAISFFHTHFFILWVLTYMQLRHIMTKNLANKKLDPETMTLHKKRVLIPLIISLLAIIISPIVHFWSLLLYLFILPGLWITSRK